MRFVNVSEATTALESLVGQRFKKDRYGTRQIVILESIRRDRVQLRVPEHKEAFTLPTAKFLKFFEACKK